MTFEEAHKILNEMIACVGCLNGRINWTYVYIQTGYTLDNFHEALQVLSEYGMLKQEAGGFSLDPDYVPDAMRRLSEAGRCVAYEDNGVVRYLPVG